jgi:hypothetical protein
VVLGYLNIEETLFMVSSQPKRAEARIKLIFELGDKALVVRSSKDILDNDVRSHANNQPLQSPFESLTPHLESELWNFVASIVKVTSEDLGGSLKQQVESKKNTKIS